MHDMVERYKLERSCHRVQEENTSHHLIGLNLEREDHRISQEGDLIHDDQSEQDNPAESFVSCQYLNPIGICGENWKSEKASYSLVVFWDYVDFALDELVEHCWELEPMLSVHDKNIFDVGYQKEQE